MLSSTAMTREIFRPDVGDAAQRHGGGDGNQTVTAIVTATRGTGGVLTLTP